jgi:hypothetical protein
VDFSDSSMGDRRASFNDVRNLAEIVSLELSLTFSPPPNEAGTKDAD